MTERPIMFSGPMVRAILRGEKTCTRRVVKAEHCPIRTEPFNSPNVTLVDENGVVREWLYFTPPTSGLINLVRPGCRHEKPTKARVRRAVERCSDSKWSQSEASGLCPYGIRGDRLWVRETWQTCTTPDDRDRSQVVYAADHNDARPGFAEDDWSWRPSIFMPRWAARIELQITSVTMERLHAISADDIVAEGVRVPVDRDGHALVRVGGANSPLEFLDPTKPRTAEDHLRAEWAALWCEINGRASWDANPWVWVVRFERVTGAT